MYDPFLDDKSTNDNGQSKLLSVKQPPILNFHLSKLEWKNNDSRKRPRSEPSQASGRIEGRNDSRGSASAVNVPTSVAQQNAPFRADQKHDASKRMTSEPPREVVRVVEKPVFYEPTTILGTPPLVDDRVRQLVHFILQHVTDNNIEVEAKLGLLIEREKADRVINLVPVMCETPINAESNADVRFVSDVGEDLFRRANRRLNARVEETSSQTEGRVNYIRTRELDVYYPRRIRQIKQRIADSREYKVLKSQMKTRLGDLNVLCPGRICDIRYSASREEDCDVPNCEPEMQREKDRISYKYEFVSVDITTVEMLTRSGGVERTHEIEVEIDASTNLFMEVLKYRKNDESSKLFDIATSLVHTIRHLLEL